MENNFDNYLKRFNLDDNNIRLKYDHSCRVMHLTSKYARNLGFSDYDVKLASLIGLLHDIGRFEQLKTYDSFYDKETIDHADLGVKILFEDGLIKKFWDNKKDYELIEFAIKNHNKKNISKCNNKDYIKQAKLIRDVDKIDIMYIYGVTDELKIRGTHDKISDEVLENIRQHKIISYEMTKNDNDKIALSFAFAFDINYDECLGEFKKYLNKFYDKLTYKEEFDEILNIINEYIDERMNSYVRN